MKEKNNLLIFILTIGVFGIINTEMGVLGILPLLAEKFSISIAQAGLLVSLFALAVAAAGPVLPLLFAGIDRKRVMLLVLSVFVLGNLISVFTDNFAVMLLARVVGVSAGMVLGVPVSSFIAGSFSLTAAMAGFTVVNTAALIATWLYIPSLPVAARLSYGQQLRVLKKPVLWFSIAGRMLSAGASADKLVIIFPVTLGIVYAAFFWSGTSVPAMALITLLWGVLGGMNANINQYWITTAAPEAPDFANGLFLTAANLGTALGSAVCGMVIAHMGMQYMMWGGIVFLILCLAMIIPRVYRSDEYVCLGESK